jgi:hypothetical protein
MSSISVSSETKQEFDALKDGQTHDEMMQELIETYKQNDTDLALDLIVDELSDELSDRVATDIEFAARRGCLEALEEKL